MKNCAVNYAGTLPICLANRHSISSNINAHAVEVTVSLGDPSRVGVADFVLPGIWEWQLVDYLQVRALWKGDFVFNLSIQSVHPFSQVQSCQFFKFDLIIFFVSPVFVHPSDQH